MEWMFPTAFLLCITSLPRPPFVSYLTLIGRRAFLHTYLVMRSYLSLCLTANSAIVLRTTIQKNLWSNQEACRNW